jgi:FkbM family methyltransferase
MVDIKAWIQRNLPRDGIVVEAGTADGDDTAWFANYFSEGRIYGFEPYENFFNMTKEKTREFSNVEISPFALDSKTGVKKFYISDRYGEDWGSSSLLKPKDHLVAHPAITFKSEKMVQTINLDEWFSTKSIPEISLMWLDIQGSEPDVLMNAPNILKKTRYLFTEVSLIETYEHVMLWSEFRKFLESSGFEVIGEQLPWQDMGNILLQNKSFVSKDE